MEWYLAIEGHSTYSPLVSDFPVTAWTCGTREIAWSDCPATTCVPCTVPKFKYLDIANSLDPQMNRPTWRPATQNVSLVDSCYLQTYSTCTISGTDPSTAFYQWMNTGECNSAGIYNAQTPSQAARLLNESLLRIPNIAGPGKIKFDTVVAPNTISVVGQGTQLNTLPINARIQVYDTPTTLLPCDDTALNFTSSTATTGSGTGCAGCASTGCVTSQNGFQNWLYTEQPYYLPAPPTSGDNYTKFFFLFSAEGPDSKPAKNTPFFGNQTGTTPWTLALFLEFVNEFHSQSLTSPVWANTDGPPTNSIPRTNFGIYDMNWMCKKLD